MNNGFIWSSEYSVNIPGIDEQHKEFLNIVNDLLKLVGDTPFIDQEAEFLCERLGNYALYHLSTEEYLFAKTGYTESAEHILSHNLFREKVKYFEDKIKDKNKDKKEVVKEMAEFSGDWLIHHILIMDKKYSRLFNEKGIL